MNISEATHCKFTADELLETIPKFLVANGGNLPVWVLGLDSIFQTLFKDNRAIKKFVVF